MGAAAIFVGAICAITITQALSLSQALYPRDSETRDVRSLDGLWHFVRGDPFNVSAGIAERWFDRDLNHIHPTATRSMPVPASYNDIGTEAALRDHVGTVWYDRHFMVARAWRQAGQRVWLRFGSVNRAATVWVNGVQVAQHEHGHLPFEADVTEALHFGAQNRVTVMCDNRLEATTVPQGWIEEMEGDNGHTMVQSYSFDFFNYAGIHRSVQLYATPAVHIGAIELATTVSGTTGRIHFNVTARSATDAIQPSLTIRLQVIDRLGNTVASAFTDETLTGSVDVSDAQLWWPVLMHPQPGYLYTLDVALVAAGAVVLDVYRLPVGIRTLRWTAKDFLINEKPVYMRGFGRHEDSDIRGRGFDLAVLARDFELMRWTGANAYRTTHYPYSEESMQLADETGIMVIAECASVNAEHFGAELMNNHLAALEGLIVRDRNHASVVMWSIANEARSTQSGADAYFGRVAQFTRSLDASRPLTAASFVSPFDDLAAQHLDIVGFNRYNGWYTNAGRLDQITGRVVREAQEWHDRYQKPVMMLEYGADTMEGVHLLPSFVWTEDYQRELLARHFRAFDELRSRGFFVGEFIWNLADFKTGQSITRVGGNKKGVFTRQRQPKAAAHLVRQRYQTMGHDEAGVCALPDDLFAYVFEPISRQ